MPAFVILATCDTDLADQWERQVAKGSVVIRFEGDDLRLASSPGLAAIVVLDASVESSLPASLVRCPTIYVGEPKTLPYEQARLAKRARLYLSYEESTTRLRDILPLFEDIAEKQSLVD